MTDDTYDYEVSWELSCDGLSAPITGGSPYSATHAVPPGSCNLVLMDSYGDGWQGAPGERPDPTPLPATPYNPEPKPRGRCHLVCAWLDRQKLHPGPRV